MKNTPNLYDTLFQIFGQHHSNSQYGTLFAQKRQNLLKLIVYGYRSEKSYDKTPVEIIIFA